MADPTLTALIARYPRLAWRAETDHHVGQRGQIVVTVWRDGGDLDGWRAFAAADGLRVATRSGSAVEAVEKLATIDARREDFARGSRQAQEYVDWCRTQSASARERLAQAQERWARERAVCEALEQRQAQTDRRWRAVREEAVFEEAADSLASAARARQR